MVDNSAVLVSIVGGLDNAIATAADASNDGAVVVNYVNSCKCVVTTGGASVVSAVAAVAVVAPPTCLERHSVFNGDIAGAH